MKKPRRIEGQVTDARVEPEYYVAPLTGWRRALLWLLTTQAGLSVLCVLIIGSFFVGYHFFGWPALTLLAGILIGWVIGYWTAYRNYVDEGYVPKL